MAPWKKIADLKHTVPASSAPDVPQDDRFHRLLGEHPWLLLPPAIRRRFGKSLDAGAAVTYVGAVVQSRRTWFGSLLARLCVAIGGPLPLHDDVGVPSVVTVTKDCDTGGQFWTRMYGRRGGFPQIVHSSKRFAGPTGLEEYIGCGFGIALSLNADAEALHFHSHHYFFCLGHLRLRLPSLLSPGDLTISHIDFAGDWFAFVLTLRHPLFGEIISQTCLFRERAEHHQGDPQ